MQGERLFTTDSPVRTVDAYFKQIRDLVHQGNMTWHLLTDHPDQSNLNVFVVPHPIPNLRKIKLQINAWGLLIRVHR